MIVLAFHKAKGLITTHRDEHNRETVYDRLQAVLPPSLKKVRWHAVGRLDKDTTGLLLFTDDPAFLQYATQPTSGLTKTYRALAKGLLTERDLDQLRSGVELSGGLGKSGPAEVRLINHQVATTWIELVLREGKNREVRRMLLAIGSQVIRLERIRVGGLELDLPVDAYRRLERGEISEKLGYSSTVTTAPASTSGRRPSPRPRRQTPEHASRSRSRR